MQTAELLLNRRMDRRSSAATFIAAPLQVTEFFHQASSNAFPALRGSRFTVRVRRIQIDLQIEIQIELEF